METAAKYREDEQGLFPHMLALAVKSLEANPAQDFLGTAYMALELNQHQKGQFFTPYHICEFMAEIQATDLSGDSLDLPGKGYISVHGPACGAGAMLIGFANVARKRGINYQEKVLFVAQDIDRAVAMMCYIQLSLLGCPAIVIVGDSLASPGLQSDNETWYTPMYHLNAWRFKGREFVEAGTGISEVQKTQEVPGMAEVPEVSGMPEVQGMPKVPEVSGMPAVPEMPEMAEVPEMQAPGNGKRLTEEACGQLSFFLEAI
jgi:hypothetical protein